MAFFFIIYTKITVMLMKDPKENFMFKGKKKGNCSITGKNTLLSLHSFYNLKEFRFQKNILCILIKLPM